ncbi:uncharacterized protein V1510DRAFT_426475 [Dipodascopsis tothii]|uniref:uncharacterized protein n=1 Tax=Dipodascopsis tothii TaxID=44089 RepID=UPI0034CEB47E
MSVLSIMSTSAPYHLMAWSTLFGSTMYQSFYVGIMSFKALPRQEFSNLQRKLFPPFFSMQAAVPLFLLLTTPASVKGVNTVVVTLLTASLTGLINRTIVTPWTVKLMTARRVQEKKEGKAYYEAGASDHMKKLNKEFGMAHGISTLLNFGTLIATAIYGCVLSNAMVRGFKL